MLYQVQAHGSRIVILHRFFIIPSLIFLVADDRLFIISNHIITRLDGSGSIIIEYNRHI